MTSGVHLALEDCGESSNQAPQALKARTGHNILDAALKRLLHPKPSFQELFMVGAKLPPEEPVAARYKERTACG